MQRLLKLGTKQGLHMIRRRRHDGQEYRTGRGKGGARGVLVGKNFTAAWAGLKPFEMA